LAFLYVHAAYIFTPHWATLILDWHGCDSSPKTSLLHIQHSTEENAMPDTLNTVGPAPHRRSTLPIDFIRPRRAPEVRCGQILDLVSEELKTWFTERIGCMAARREIAANRYFAVNVTRLSDVSAGWRHFIGALERRETVACLFVIEDPASVAASLPAAPTLTEGVAPTLCAVAEIMSTLSDEPAASLINGGSLNFGISLPCPVTGCRTPFLDFDAVAFVPGAADRRDPLYDPLMCAPVPMVNVSSDIYGFAMFTRDFCLRRHECEVNYLTRRERRALFAQAATAWQRMAERTISNYASMVDQDLCPTFLTPDRRSWVANHRDPAFAELEKRPHQHEMPVQYTERVLKIWDAYFDLGTWPRYRDAAKPGESSHGGCPVGHRV
jgi:hypothetical protein